MLIKWENTRETIALWKKMIIGAIKGIQPLTKDWDGCL